jgi:RimJ/RimL family protein N-acetyltransferase
VGDERVELRGENVVLRAYRADEVDEAYQQAMSSTSRVGELSFERLQLRVGRSGRFVEGRLDLAVETEGRLVGSIEARYAEHAFPPGVCEIGIELVPEVRGRGVGTQAVGTLARYLLANGYGRVQASTDIENAAMRRALERAGFTFEGTLRGFMPDGDGRADYAMYAMTEGDVGP